jgi:hypothetical protein
MSILRRAGRHVASNATQARRWRVDPGLAHVDLPIVYGMFFVVLLIVFAMCCAVCAPMGGGGARRPRRSRRRRPRGLLG